MNIEDNRLLKAFRILENKDRKKLVAVTILQVALGFLDLAGVLILGLIGALSVSGLQSQVPDTRVQNILNMFSLANLTFQEQVGILGGIAVVILIGRTMSSVYLTRKILFFMSRRGAVISSNLVSRLLNRSLLVIQKRTTQETLYAVTRGVDLIVLQVLAMVSIMISDLALLIILSIGLFAIDPMTAILTFGMFTVVGFFLYRHMRIKAELLGRSNSQLTITSSEKIVEVLTAYRELYTRDRREYYALEIGRLRKDLANASAESAFMPFVSKYVIESVVVIGVVLIGAFQFLTNDATHAISTITVFMAAGTRIAPSVLRVQQTLIQIKGSLSAAEPTIELSEELGDSRIILNSNNEILREHRGFTPEIRLRNLTMSYPGNSNYSLNSVQLTIKPGSLVAIVGPSGAGKTSLVDVLLGVIPYNVGLVEISNSTPTDAIKKWPGAIAYVPQEVSITSGTLRENIALGFPIELATDALLESIIEMSLLKDLINNLPHGLDSKLGERGTRISGGEKQRIGIARALFTNPMLLVLDEATSSLDGETEEGISQSLQSLRGTKTLVLVAHRLSSVRNADMVVYMNQGKIIAAGTFNEVRAAVPDFDRQANLMGI